MVCFKSLDSATVALVGGDVLEGAFLRSEGETAGLDLLVQISSERISLLQLSHLIVVSLDLGVDFRYCLERYFCLGRLQIFDLPHIENEG